VVHHRNIGICGDCAPQREGYFDDKGPPLDKIYEGLVGKFGYVAAVSVHQGC
jgi:hypothetical protein